MRLIYQIAEVTFWGSVFFIFYSYALYPFLLFILSRGKKDNKNIYGKNDNLPVASLLISVHNEEEVIEEKILSVLDSNYPLAKYEILVGSDASTDNTDLIIEKLDREYENVHFFPFDERGGKGNVINKLEQRAKGEILVFTDANIIFEKQTLYEIVKHFKNKQVGLVDANMINRGLKRDGISYQEKAYVSREVLIKYREGLIWGTMMGPFGGCFAVRKTLFTPVPGNALVDDFYINMKILSKGKMALNNLNARVYEDVSNNLPEEYRRKKRIAAGNFQNLKWFSHLLFSNRKGLSFSFFSHKVIRWIIPFLIILAFLSNIILLQSGWLYSYAFYFQVLLLLIPFIDYFLRKIKIHVVILRFVTHFYFMNLALLSGFFKFLKGVKSNVWQPTKRNQ
ncbi:MAG: glycosyltransferase [Bacteroidota bacterium]